MTGLGQQSLRSLDGGGLSAAVRPQGCAVHLAFPGCACLHLLAQTCTYLHKQNYFSAPTFLPLNLHPGPIRTNPDQFEAPRRLDSIPADQNRTKPDDSGWGVKNRSLIINEFR